jgi:hypothetical protein
MLFSVLFLILLFTAGFTSMLVQAIPHRSRALMGADNTVRTKQINIYIRWFSRSYLWMFLNLCMYAWQFGVYAIIITVASKTLVVRILLCLLLSCFSIFGYLVPTNASVTAS